MKNPFIKKSVFVLGGIFFILLIYLLANPLIMSHTKILIPRRLVNLEYARNYYSIISNFFGVLIACSGLVLGFFYYKSRLDFDKFISHRDRKRKHLDCLLKELNTFDDFVDTIICYRFRKEDELKHLRKKILRSFENIEIMLEVNDKLLDFAENDIKKILAVNSYVEKNDLIMFVEFSKLKEEILLTIKDKYIGYIQEARRVCYSKIE